MGFTAILPTTQFLNEIATVGSVPDPTLLFYGGLTTVLVALWALGRFTLGMTGPRASAA